MGALKVQSYSMLITLGNEIEEHQVNLSLKNLIALSLMILASVSYADERYFSYLTLHDIVASGTTREIRDFVNSEHCNDCLNQEVDGHTPISIAILNLNVRNFNALRALGAELNTQVNGTDPRSWLEQHQYQINYTITSDGRAIENDVIDLGEIETESERLRSYDRLIQESLRAALFVPQFTDHAADRIESARGPYNESSEKLSSARRRYEERRVKNRAINRLLSFY